MNQEIKEFIKETVKETIKETMQSFGINDCTINNLYSYFNERTDGIDELRTLVHFLDSRETETSQDILGILLEIRKIQHPEDFI